MKKILTALALLLFTVIAMGQEMKIDIFRTPGVASSSWLLLENDKKLVFSEHDYHRTDSVSLVLEKNRMYYLAVSVEDIHINDTTLYTVYFDGKEEFTVSTDLGYGDHFLPFNTGMQNVDTTKIIGGTDAEIADFPYQVLLIYRTDGHMYSCGGTIIGDEWIMTAAHCTDDDYHNLPEPGELSVYAGSSYFMEGTEYVVDSIVRHEDFNPITLVNDISLLRLEHPINTSNATPIRLVSSGDVAEGVTEPGVMGTLTGWGLVDVSPETYTYKLQQVELPIVSYETAATVWGLGIPDNLIMAGYHNGNKDACSGDSGGPLVVEVGDEGYKVAGIVSWGSADCNTYGGYTEVSAFEPWIREKTGIVDQAPATPEGDTLICQGTTTTIYTTEALAGADDYEWELFPQDAGAIENNGLSGTVIWNPGFTGDLMVKVRAVDGEGRSVWSRLGVTIAKNTDISDFTQEISICSNQSFSLNVETTGYNLQYDWYKEDLLVSSGTTSGLQYANATESLAGYYHCVVTGSCGTKTTEDINVEIMPLTVINYTTPDTTIVFGSDASIRVDVTGHDLNYQWKKDGIDIVGVNRATLEFESIDANDIGNYYCIVTGSCGTKSSIRHYLYVDNIRETGMPEISMWPTITQGIVNVAMSDNTEYSVRIFNSIGKLMYDERGLRHQSTIDIGHFPRGLYIVKVYNDNIQRTQRVIKEN